jgi:hypothetical protein
MLDAVSLFGLSLIAFTFSLVCVLISSLLDLTASLGSMQTCHIDVRIAGG